MRCPMVGVGFAWASMPAPLCTLRVGAADTDSMTAAATWHGCRWARAGPEPGAAWPGDGAGYAVAVNDRPTRLARRLISR